MLEEGIIRVIRGLERPVFLRVPLGVILSVFKVTVISVISRVVVILGTETSSSLESCSLLCPVVLWTVGGENLRRCAETTCVALGHLVFEGCAYILEVHYHSLTFTGRFTLGNWPWCISKTELETELKKSYHPKFPLVKLPGAFTQTASFRTHA